MTSSMPFQLLFNQPVAQLRKGLQHIVDSGPEFSLEVAAHQNTNVFVLQHGSLGFELAWSEDVPSLSGYRSVFLDTSFSATKAVLSIDLGPNLRGGNRVAPVVQAFLALGAQLAIQLSAFAIVWNPAKLVSQPAFFADNVQSYGNGGVFPVLSLVDFEYSDNERRLRSSGLSWFAGQEIDLHGCDFAGQELVRRAVRLVHDIATNGAIVLGQDVPDIEREKFLELTPADENKLLRCEIISRMDVKAETTALH